MKKRNDKEFFPNFLGIGAAKAGTSWLWWNLRHHPDIWLPYYKEIHYFDRSAEYLSPNFLCNNGLFERFFNLQWRDLLKQSIRRNLHHVSWQQVSWDVKFCFGRYNDAWYASLFKPGNGKVKGEITPAYSILELRDIQHIKTIMPQVRIIFLIRNPIERAWSNVRYNLSQQDNFRTLNSYSLSDFKKIVDSDSSSLRSDYVRTMTNWRTCFPEQNFFIGFYEDIAMNPVEFLLRVFKFLDVESSTRYIAEEVSKRRNPSLSKEIPMEFKVYLAHKYYSQIKILSTMLGGYANTWLQEVETLCMRT